MRRNVHFVATSFNKRNSSRILKETRSLVELSVCDEVEVVGRRQAGEPEYEKIDDKRKVLRIQSSFEDKPKTIFWEFIKYFEYLIKALRYYKNVKVDYVNIHSLHVLPIGVMFKLLYKSVLIYDAHELETEVAGAKGVKKKLAKQAEKFLIRFVDKLIVVSPQIKEWYCKAYKLKMEDVTVIRNIPNQVKNLEPSNLLKDEFAISSQEILFIYQGKLGEERGCRKLLDLFKEMPDEKHIVFMGFGPMEDEIKQVAAKHRNIHFKNAVPAEDILKYTSSADIGLHFIHVGDVLNHKYCLPNKFFEYVVNGLPVVVNQKAVEMTQLVEQYKLGYAVNADELDIQEVKKLLTSITPEQISEKRQNALKSKELFYWEKEAELYKYIYNVSSETLSYA